VLTRSNGCDSVVSLALTLNSSIATVDSISACDRFTWINGNTYTVSTSTPTHLLSRRNGCDSLVSLYLEINNSSNTIVSDTAEGAYYWNFTRMYYLNSGVYYFHGATVYDCDSLAQLNLTIIPYTIFYAANSFTPNNDGINDKFIPIFNSAYAIDFTITNRWGNVVFQTNDIHSEGWDGSYNNVPQPTSTYTWRMAIDYNNGKKLEKTGVVTLIR
jgi:gliding motility-associated-like protein